MTNFFERIIFFAFFLFIFRTFDIMAQYIKLRFFGPDKNTETNFSVKTNTKMEFLMVAYARKCRLPSRNLLFYIDDSIIISPNATPAILNLRPNQVINVYETVFDPYEDEVAPPPPVQMSNSIQNHAPEPSTASAQTPVPVQKMPIPEPEPEPEPSQASQLPTKASFIVRDIYDRHFVAKIPLNK